MCLAIGVTDGSEANERRKQVVDEGGRANFERLQWSSAQVFHHCTREL